MRSGEFRARALHEGHRYGEDEMVFVREFAQNARDAGGSQIVVETKYANGAFELTFQDNGRGLSQEDAKTFLFKLYSSSKEKESESAGRFGVGFWSILLFKPSYLEIMSRTKSGSSWKVTMDGNLHVSSMDDGTLEEAGFRITVARPVADEMEFRRLSKKAKRATVRYCRFLRCNDGDSSPLPIVFDGDTVNEPFSLDGQCAAVFKDGPREGAIGLGDHPKVELYTKGLLVWRGTVLEELRYGAPLSRTPSYTKGLAPVFLLGASNLNVTMDRRAVIDDSALSKVRLSAKRRMRKLLLEFVDGVNRRNGFQRFYDRIVHVAEDVLAGDYNRLLVILGALVTVSLVASLGFYLLPWGPVVAPLYDELGDPNPQGAARTSKPSQPFRSMRLGNPAPLAGRLGNPAPFAGPSVNPRRNMEQIELAYEPPTPNLFRVAAFERLSPGLGIGSGPKGNRSAKRGVRCKGACTTVRLSIDVNEGPLVLPCTTGGRVVPESLHLNGKAQDVLKLTPTFEPVIQFSKGGAGELQYRIAENAESLSPGRRERLLRIPNEMTLPDALKSEVRKARDHTRVASRVSAIREFVRDTIAYDDSVETSRAYDNFLSNGKNKGWLEFVLEYGRGDCDVKNTVVVVALRELGIPARLAVGFIGSEGAVLPGMHAWVEYYDGKWRTADASGTYPDAPPTTREVEAIARNGTKEPRSEAFQRSRYFWVAILAGIFAAFVLVAAFLIRGGLRSRAPTPDPGEMENRKFMLASLADRGISVYGSLLAVNRTPVYPVLGSVHGMSKLEATRRASTSHLWYSNGTNDSARKAIAGGARILDLSSERFAKLIRRLPGIKDLDEIDSLKQVSPNSLVGSLRVVGELLNHVNRVLKDVGLKDASVLPCHGLLASDVRDVDLAGLGGLKEGVSGVMFVAINPKWDVIHKNLELAKGDQDLAAFKTLVSIVKRSALLLPYKKQILTLAAKRVVGGGN